jgi:hypothetical protein
MIVVFFYNDSYLWNIANDIQGVKTVEAKEQRNLLPVTSTIEAL